MTAMICVGQRADARIETDFFDLWGMESFKQIRTTSTYTRFDIAVG
jgi:hypothetical protein